MKYPMKLQVGKASDGTYFWHKKIRGKITGHGADYNSRALAVNGLLDDMISSWKFIVCSVHDEFDKEDVDALRRVLKSQVEFISEE